MKKELQLQSKQATFYKQRGANLATDAWRWHEPFTAPREASATRRPRVPPRPPHLVTPRITVGAGQRLSALPRPPRSSTLPQGHSNRDTSPRISACQIDWCRRERCNSTASSLQLTATPAIPLRPSRPHAQPLLCKPLRRNQPRRVQLTQVCNCSLSDPDVLQFDYTTWRRLNAAECETILILFYQYY